MGRKTYTQIATELSPDLWPYNNAMSYIWTKNPILHKNMENRIFIDENIFDFIKKIKSQEGKNIFLVGGAELIKQFIDLNLIDEYIICTIPIIIGNGISLFPNIIYDIPLEIIKTISSKFGVITIYKAIKISE